MVSLGNEMDRKPCRDTRTIRDSIEMGETCARAGLICRRVQHLLVVTTFTRCSEYAIARAVECGNELDAQVTILHVIVPGPTRNTTKYRQRKARESLETRVDILSTYALRDISIKVRAGELCLEIARAAIELGSDMIVLGLDDKGQTAAAIARYTNKPILLVTRPTTGPYRRSIIDVSNAPQSTADAAFRIVPTAESHFVIVRSPSRYDGAIEVPPEQRSTRPHSVACWHDILNYRLSWKPVSLIQATGDSIDVLFGAIDDVGGDLLVVDADGALQGAFEHENGLLHRFSAAPPCDLMLVAGTQ
jgi:hypothetical protein